VRDQGGHRARQQRQPDQAAAQGWRLRVAGPGPRQHRGQQRAAEQPADMGGVVDAGDHQPHAQRGQREQAGKAEQPAELAPLHMPPFAPQEHQQRAVQAEHRAGRPAGHRLVALHHQRQQVAAQAAGQVEQRRSASGPSSRSISRPTSHSAHMFSARCRMPKCRNIAVPSRHHCPSCVAGPKFAPQVSWTALEWCDQPAPKPIIARNTSTLAATSSSVTGSAPGAVVHQLRQAGAGLGIGRSVGWGCSVAHRSLYYSRSPWRPAMDGDRKLATICA
jgi:hypothetical protein